MTFELPPRVSDIELIAHGEPPAGTVISVYHENGFSYGVLVGGVKRPDGSLALLVRPFLPRRTHEQGIWDEHDPHLQIVDCCGPYAPHNMRAFPHEIEVAPGVTRTFHSVIEDGLLDE